MKKLHTFAIIILFFSTASGQISIQSADLPQAGDTFRVSTGAAFTGMDVNQTGPNYTWDYSQLTSINQTVDTFLDVGSTNPLYSVIFANIPFYPNRCNLANLGPSFSLGTTLSINNVYNFYYNSSSSYTQKGFGAEVNAVPLPVIYSQFDVIYHLPLNYGAIDSSASSYHIDLLSTLGFYYKVNRMRNNVVDGWGSLTTPFGTFDALRVKSTIVEQDSVYLDTVIHIGFNLPLITTVEYKWLGVGQGIPLLQINTNGTGVVSQIMYRDSLHDVSGIGDLPALSGTVEVFPNPSTNDLFISFELRKSCCVSMELFSMKGEKVYEGIPVLEMAGKHRKKIPVHQLALAPGNYLLRTIIDGQTSLNQVFIGKQ